MFMMANGLAQLVDLALFDLPDRSFDRWLPIFVPIFHHTIFGGRCHGPIIFPKRSLKINPVIR